MPDTDYPDHVREAAEAIDELRAQRRRQLAPRELALQAFLSRIGRPRFVIAVAVFIVVWVTANLLLARDHANLDTPQFTLLNTSAQLVSLLLVIGIFSAQNTENNLEQERARLMLQLSIIQDRKITALLGAIERLTAHTDDSARTSPVPHDLRKPTDIHEAAHALEEAEQRE